MSGFGEKNGTFHNTESLEKDLFERTAKALCLSGVQDPSFTCIKICAREEDVMDTSDNGYIVERKAGKLFIYKQNADWWSAGQFMCDHDGVIFEENEETLALFYIAASEIAAASRGQRTPLLDCEGGMYASVSDGKRVYSTTSVSLTALASLYRLHPDMSDFLIGFPVCNVQEQPVEKANAENESRSSDPSDRLIFSFNYRCGDIGYTFDLEKSIYPSCISVKATMETLAGNTYRKREKRREIRDFDFDCLKEYLERIETRETPGGKCKYFIADRTTGKEYGFDRIEKCLLDFFNYYSDIKLETDPADIVDHHDSRYVKIDNRSVEPCEFKGNRFVRYLSVPEGVPHIGDEAFAGSSLREISFPDAFFAYSGTRKEFPTVGKNIFIGCEDLSCVVCDDDSFSGISEENIATVAEGCPGAESGALLLRHLIECTKTLPNVRFIKFGDRNRDAR